MKPAELAKSTCGSISKSRGNSRAASRQPASKTADSGESLRLESLLVPTDFSDCSYKAMGYAENLAKLYGSTVELLHVLEPARIPHGLKMSYSDWEDLMVRNAHCNLSQISSENIDDIIPVRSEVRIGSSYREICTAAGCHKSDLIIIGTHGRTGLKHLFLGSTAERVIRYAPCSVLVVRGLDPSAAGRLRPERILVPTDLSPLSNEAIRAAVALATQFKSALALVHVVSTTYAVGEYGAFDYSALLESLREAAKKDLASISKKIAAKGIRVTTHILDGRPATQILEAAKTYKADLIVVSTHGRTGLNHVLLGSTTEEVARLAHCPVLAYRSQLALNPIPG